LVSGIGLANERHFTYTYETATLPKGEVEFEPWTTIKYGRNDYYAKFEQQIEFEYGITDNLQMAWYIVYAGYAQEKTNDDGDQYLKKGWKMPGIKSEWKYKLSDPVADSIGSALYFELVGKPHEFEVETKILLDKKMGSWLVAFNAVVEAEWEKEENLEIGKKLQLEADLGIAYQPFPGFSIGVEVRNVNVLADMKDFEKSILYAGPVVSYATDKWWVATTIMPQVYAIKGASDNNFLDLEDHERVEMRVLFGIHL